MGHVDEDEVENRKCVDNLRLDNLDHRFGNHDHRLRLFVASEIIGDVEGGFRGAEIVFVAGGDFAAALRAGEFIIMVAGIPDAPGAPQWRPRRQVWP